MAFVQQPVMAGTTTVVTSGVGGPVAVPVAPQARMNVSAVRGLGITQIVIGIIVIGLGIGSVAGFNSDYWLTESGGGIWGGIWILVTGIIGTCSAGQPNNYGLNAANMAFSIIATVVVFIDGIMFAVGLWYYNTCNWYGYSYYYYNYNYHSRYLTRYRFDCIKHQDAGRAVYGILVMLMVAEFFIALVNAVYCCQASASCCARGSTGVIIQQQQPQYIMTSSTGQTMMTPAYHNQAYPQQPMVISSYGQQPAQMYPQQHVQQAHVMQPGYPPVTQPAAQTNVSYSTDYPQQEKTAPPPYSG